MKTLTRLSRRQVVSNLEIQNNQLYIYIRLVWSLIQYTPSKLFVYSNVAVSLQSSCPKLTLLYNIILSLVSEKQIKRLYVRFLHLDSSSSGTLRYFKILIIMYTFNNNNINYITLGVWIELDRNQYPSITVHVS